MIAMSPMIRAASKMPANFVYESFCTPAQIRLIKCNVYCIGKKLEMDCKMEKTAINAAAYHPSCKSSNVMLGSSFES